MSRAIRRAVGCALPLLAAALLAGCESKVNVAKSDDPDEITPPATAGTVDQLVGTSWAFKGLDMVATFSGPSGAAAPAVEGAEAMAPPMMVKLSNPANPSESMNAYWRLRANGVISMTIMGTTRAGTWDGNQLVLSGEAGVKTASAG